MITPAPLEIFLSTDQPVTCPKCGSRTDIVRDVLLAISEAQVEECLNTSCAYQFIVEAEQAD